MPEQIGDTNYAVCWSMDGNLTYAIGGTSRLLATKSASWAPTAERIDTKDGDGTTRNITFFNQGATLSLSLTPRGATKDAATVVARAAPVKGTRMTVITPSGDRTDTNLGAASTGTEYMVSECTVRHENGNPVGWDVTLERFNSISSYTALS